MTVKELIEALSNFDEDSMVYCEVSFVEYAEIENVFKDKKGNPVMQLEYM